MTAADVRGPEAAFKAYLRAGRFMLQRSRSSGAFVFYPRIAVPGSGDQDLEWTEASGGGVVYAITVNRTSGLPYNIALITLDEGPRMMSRVEGEEAVPVGTRVKARIGNECGEPLVLFDVIR